MSVAFASFPVFVGLFATLATNYSNPNRNIIQQYFHGINIDSWVVNTNGVKLSSHLMTGGYVGTSLAVEYEDTTYDDMGEYIGYQQNGGTTYVWYYYFNRGLQYYDYEQSAWYEMFDLTIEHTKQGNRDIYAKIYNPSNCIFSQYEIIYTDTNPTPNKICSFKFSFSPLNDFFKNGNLTEYYSQRYERFGKVLTLNYSDIDIYYHDYVLNNEFQITSENITLLFNQFESYKISGDAHDIHTYFWCTYIDGSTTTICDYIDNYQDLDDYESGYNLGYSQGYQNGYDKGISDANGALINQDAYQHGYQNGYDTGYQVGYSTGSNVASTYTFASLFGAIADTPILILTNLLGFEVFGVSAMNILMSMITGVIAIFLIRKFI